MDKDNPISRGSVRDGRKIKKCSMEKKRLDRISMCMDELSALLGEERRTKGDDASKSAKQERTDVLELTMKQWQSAMAVSTSMDLGAKDRIRDAEVLVSAAGDSSYLKGYKQCIQVVSDMLVTSKEPGTESLRQGLLQHLSSRVQELTSQPVVPVSAGCDATLTGKPLVAEAKEEPYRCPVSSEPCVPEPQHPVGPSAISQQEGSSSNHPKRRETSSTSMVLEHKTSRCGASTKTTRELQTIQATKGSYAACQKGPVSGLKTKQDLNSPKPTPGALSDPTVIKRPKFLPARSTLVRVEPLPQKDESESLAETLERPAKSRRIEVQDKCNEGEFAIIKEDAKVPKNCLCKQSCG